MFMMTEEQVIAKFIELHDNPDSLTEEQLSQLLDDGQMHDLVMKMAFAKRMLKTKDEYTSQPDVDSEWAAFSATHSAELDALDEETYTPSKAHSLFSFFRYKNVAAIIIGILCFAGVSFATVHIIRHVIQSSKTTEPPVIDKEQIHPGGNSSYNVTNDGSDNLAESGQNDSIITDDDSKDNALPVMQVIPDSVPSEPHVFNNVKLESMLMDMSQFYKVELVFKNEHARNLRFHFVWNKKDPLDRVVEKLNNFETVDIVVENEKMMVR